jgi:protein-L-isoaspartate(D-aspartate) O-methyltransferase
MTAMNLEQARFNMIEQQIRTWDVLDDNVLKILSATPREAFVPEKYRGLAFTDINIPLGHEQVMMAPKLEARLLQALDLKVSDSILEIGTGSGYLAACLARLGGSVHSVDLYDDFL